MRHKCVPYDFFLFNLLQNRRLVCSSSRDRHARNLSLRDDPKSHFKEDCTILCYKNKTLGYFSVNFVHEFVGYFASNSKMFENSLIFTTKLYQEFVKSRTKLSLDLSQLPLVL